MQAVVATVLVYPLRPDEKWLAATIRGWKSEEATSAFARFALNQFESFISFYHSPLVLKGALAAVPAILAVLCIVAGRILSPALEGREGCPESPPTEGGPVAGPGAPLPRHAFWTALAFIAWSCLSVLWSPTPAFSLDAAMWLAAFGAFGFAMLRRGVTADESRQYATLLVLLGTVVCVLSLGQASSITAPWVARVFLRFDDPRNMLGSLMGHNTAVASLVLMGCFPALAMALSTRSSLARWALSAYLAMASLVALLVQSRAIWILGGTLGAIFVRHAVRARGGRLPRRALALLGATLALALASQFVNAPWNPLYLEHFPLARRLRDFSPEVLHTGTRARMHVCTLPLLADRPLVGHGLHSFQFVYPKAQGDWFARYPDSILGNTVKRSHMAHDEYLQAWIETGIVGLALMLATLGELFRRGFRARRDLSAEDAPTGERLVHAAFGFSTAALCIHGVADFHFHVPQVVTPWLLCAAAFASRRPGGPFDAPALEAAPPEPNTAPRRAQASDPAVLRSGPVARLLLGWCCVLAAPVLIFPAVRAYQADIDFNYGQAYLSSVRDSGGQFPPDEAQRYLSIAERDLTRAATLQPGHNSARSLLGEVHYQRGLLLVRLEESQPPGVPRNYQPALQALQLAADNLQVGLGVLRYHNNFYQLALVYQAMLRVLPEGRREPVEREYRRTLEQAVHYERSFVTPAYFLERWLAAREPGSERASELRRTIKRFDHFFFHRAYAVPANRAYAARDFPVALDFARVMLDADPEDPDLVIFAMNVLMETGDEAGTLRMIEALEAMKVAPGEFHPTWRSYAALYRAILEKDWSAALRSLEGYGTEQPETRAMLRSVESLARERAGLPEAPTRYPRPQGSSEESWERLVAERRAFVLHRLFHEPEAARAAYEARIAMGGAEPSLAFWIDRAWLAREQGDEAALESAIERARAIDPKATVLRRLAGGA